MSSVHKQRKNVRDRLVRAEGHLRGIIKMIDEDKECPDILIQVGAVKAALEKVGMIILEDHWSTAWSRPSSRATPSPRSRSSRRRYRN